MLQWTSSDGTAIREGGLVGTALVFTLQWSRVRTAPSGGLALVLVKYYALVLVLVQVSKGRG